MKGLTDFIKNKINKVRFGQLDQLKETPAVNMTKILLNPKNILIIPYNRMGTLLLASRVFKAFREHYASAKITVAVYEPWSVLISKDPAIDNVVAYGDDIDTPNSRGFQNIGKTLAIQKFDLAFFLSYQFDPVMAYLTRLSEADLRVSFKSNYEIPYFNVELIPAAGNRYEVDRYLEMLRTLGIEGNMRDYTLKIGDSIRQKAKLRYLTGFSPDDKKKRFIGFDLTKEIAGEPINKKNTEQVINTLISGFDATVIVFFEPQKKAMVAELKESFGKKIILVDDRPVSIVAGLMSFCKFVVTHNTDLFQLAVALKTPNIGILYPKEMIQWSPGEDSNLMHLDRSGGSWSSANTILQTAKKLINQVHKVK